VMMMTTHSYSPAADEQEPQVAGLRCADYLACALCVTVLAHQGRAKRGPKLAGNDERIESWPRTETLTHRITYVPPPLES
jgi:hypothetical protein